MDQALDTINKVFNDQKESQKIKLQFFQNHILDPNEYRDISITFKTTPDQFNFLINPDIDIQEMDKESALKALSGDLEITKPIGLKDLSKCKLNLDIISQDQHNMTTEINISQAKKMIKAQDDPKIRFAIKFYEMNKTSDEIKDKILKKGKLNLELFGDDDQKIQQRIKEFIPEKTLANFIISARTDQLLKFIEKLPNKSIEVLSNKDNIDYCHLYQPEFLSEKILSHKQKTLIIKVIQMWPSEMLKLLESCDDKETRFGIEVLNINPFEIFKGKISIENTEFDVKFHSLGHLDSMELVKILRKNNIEFQLLFNKILSETGGEIIKASCLETESVEIYKVKTLSEMFLESQRPEIELSEFSSRGIEYTLDIGEKKFIPWRSIAGVAILATLQIVAGCILVSTGLLSSVGIGLITEGAADVFTAYRAYSTRQFTWSDYLQQKAVSLVVSAVCMGWEKLQKTMKNASKVVAGVAEEAVEQGISQGFTKARAAASQALQGTSKTLQSLAKKQVMVALAENGARTVLNNTASTLAKFGMEQAKPWISNHIQEKVEITFYQPQLSDLLTNMKGIEKTMKTNILQSNVQKIVQSTLNSSLFTKVWDSVILQVLKGVLSEKNESTFSLIFRVIGTLKGLHSITLMINDVHEDLVFKLTRLFFDRFRYRSIFQQCLGLSEDDAVYVSNILVEKKIIIIRSKESSKLEFYCEVLNLLAFGEKSEDFENPLCLIDEIEFGTRNIHRTNIIQLLKHLIKETRNIKVSEQLNEITKSVSDSITSQIIHIVESQLISPWSSFAVGKFVQYASKRIQHKYFVDKNQNTQKANEDEELYQKLKKMKEEGQQLNKQEQQFLKNYDPYTTISSQITSNSSEYCKVHEQLILITESQKEDKIKSGKASEKVRLYAEGVKNSEPAGRSEIALMAKKNNINCEIKSSDYILTDDDIKTGRIIIIFIKGEKDETGKDNVGHFKIHPSCAKHMDLSNMGEFNKNDCAYFIFSGLTGKSIKTLRNETAETILSNPKRFERVLEAQDYIRENHPSEANTLLFKGGNMFIEASAVIGGTLLGLTPFGWAAAVIAGAALLTLVDLAGQRTTFSGETVTQRVKEEEKEGKVKLDEGFQLKKNLEYIVACSQNHDSKTDDGGDLEPKYISLYFIESKKEQGYLMKEAGKEMMENGKTLEEQRNGADLTHCGNRVLIRASREKCKVEMINSFIAILKNDHKEAALRVVNATIELEKVGKVSSSSTSLPSSIGPSQEIEFMKRENQNFDEKYKSNLETVKEHIENPAKFLNNDPLDNFIEDAKTILDKEKGIERLQLEKANDIVTSILIKPKHYKQEIRACQKEVIDSAWKLPSETPYVYND